MGEAKEEKLICVFLIAAIALLLIASIRGKNDIFAYFELEESRDVLAKALDGIDHEIRALALEIEQIEESPSYAYRVLRDKYHVTEEGESIMFLAE